jgi:hypothetical protein
MIGPMLGGGHGLLQGYYGTLADNLVEARVVMAEGDAITVSANSNADLFWALRGAGHNFGIISEYKYKVYDHATENKWTFVEFMFTGHQLEDLYRHINDLSKDGKEMHPVQLVYLASYLRVPDIDSKNVRFIYQFSVRKAYRLINNIQQALIRFSLAYDGSPEEMETFAKPFRRLKPVRTQEYYSPYADISGHFDVGYQSGPCQPGINANFYPLSMNTHNITAQREAYDAFNEMISKYPAFAYSLLFDEGYSLQGMRAVPGESTAVADRHYNILV